jgi:hypothetical protein
VQARLTGAITHKSQAPKPKHQGNSKHQSSKSGKVPLKFG